MKIITKNNFQIIHHIILCLVSFHFHLVVAHSTNNATKNPPPKCLSHQSSALLQFKAEFAANSLQDGNPDDSAGPKTASWEADRDCCSWDGVACDGTGLVVGLDLSYGSLQGPLLANSSLFMLTHLRQLNLAFNDFNFSSIPSGFGRLSKLTLLDLSQSKLSGQIPQEISWLTDLVSLDLSSFVYESGEAPLSLGERVLSGLVRNATSLRELSLNAVDLSALRAQSFGNFSSMEALSLSESHLSGEFPKSLFVSRNLRSIDVSSNEQLTGSLPEFPPGSSLESLAVWRTRFSGSLRDTISNLKSLNSLNLGTCNFSGTIPASTGNLSYLTYLDLSSNSFTGEVPSSLGSLTNMEFLSLLRNQFGGQIPPSLGNLTQLTQLQLSYNSFSGSFPVSLANLTSLEFFSLSNNRLTGFLPLDARKFPNSLSLGSVDLSHNSFTGIVPPSLFSIPSLESLRLEFNQFAGPITIENASSSQLSSLNLRRNRLTGTIPGSISKLTSLEELFLGANGLSGNVDFRIFSELSSLATLELSYNNLSITNGVMDFSLPNFTTLGLASCNITEFPRFLKSQHEIWELDLTDNKIQGKIPKWFLNTGTESLSMLHLSRNFITGWEQDPPVLSWNGLNFINLRRNQLGGSLVIPPSSTRFYFVANNAFTGEIDPLFCELSNLTVFDVSSNRLSGEIPRCLGRDSSLLMLNLQQNNFSGDIPQPCNNGSTLKTLDVSHNQLQGKVPKSLIECKELEVLNIGHNQISDEFPFWTQSLPKLQVLVLRDNKFSGPIWHPHEFFGFEKLRIIDLSFNSFDGDLPSNYFRNWSAINAEIPSANKSTLKYLGDPDSYYQDSITLANKGSTLLYSKILNTLMSIDLSNNNLRGKIPSSIGDLKSLVVLNLSSNNFEGLIPRSLGNLRELESLDLSKNRLSGEIPQGLASLSFLAYLNLSMNRLEGRIPQGRQLSTFSNNSYEGNALLCGFPLSQECENGNETTTIDPRTESGYGFGWKSVMIGYGIGFVIGLIADYVTASWRPNYLERIYRRKRNE